MMMIVMTILLILLLMLIMRFDDVNNVDDVVPCCFASLPGLSLEVHPYPGEVLRVQLFFCCFFTRSVCLFVVCLFVVGVFFWVGGILYIVAHVDLCFYCSFTALVAKRLLSIDFTSVKIHVTSYCSNHRESKIFPYSLHSPLF